MKKTILMLLLVVAVVATGLVVYAETQDVPEWFTEMIEWRKAQVTESLEAGDITQEQADAWMQHFDDMVEFHQEVGFEGMGGCRGGRGFGGRGFGSGRGYGPGMGLGFGSNQQ